MSRQFVAVEFRSGGRKYTYHNDGEPVHAGALVKVPDRSGEGWQRATVVTAFADPPAFTTKAILGRIEPAAILAKVEASPGTLAAPGPADLLPLKAPGDLFGRAD